MSWRQRLRPAKLGKAAFFIDSADGDLGRSTQVHEYPLRDKPYVEDLGRRARRFTLDAYVLANAANQYDYMAARDALIVEIESAGPRTLVHPYLGEMTVSVVDARGPRESTAEGGMARFSITVVESGELRFPTAEPNTAEAAQTKADIAQATSTDSFVQNFDVDQAPSFVADSAAERIRDFADRIDSLVTQITTLPGAIPELIDAVRSLSAAASNLILVPQTLASSITSIFGQLRLIASQPAGALEITRSLFTFGDSLPTMPVLSTPNRQRQAINQAAMARLVEQTALYTAVRTVAALQFSSADEALALRDELVDAFDDQVERIDAEPGGASDQVYYALVDVRAAVVKDLETRAAQLAKLLQLTLPQTRPAIVVAFSLYGDALRDSDVVARNQVRHPHFVPSGQALEVLSDG